MFRSSPNWIVKLFSFNFFFIIGLSESRLDRWSWMVHPTVKMCLRICGIGDKTRPRSGKRETQREGDRCRRKGRSILNHQARSSRRKSQKSFPFEFRFLYLLLGGRGTVGRGFDCSTYIEQRAENVSNRVWIDITDWDGYGGSELGWGGDRGWSEMQSKKERKRWSSPLQVDDNQSSWFRAPFPLLLEKRRVMDG